MLTWPVSFTVSMFQVVRMKRFPINNDCRWNEVGIAVANEEPTKETFGFKISKIPSLAKNAFKKLWSLLKGAMPRC